MEYVKHFKHEIYELNPFHQEAIHKQRPIKKLTYVLWFLLLIFLYNISNWYAEALIFRSVHSINNIEFLLGALFWFYFEVLSQHVKGLMQFRYLNKFPASVQGETEISPGLLYEVNMGNFLTKALLVLCVYLIIEEVFFLGGFFGYLFLFGLSFFWKRKILKSRNLREIYREIYPRGPKLDTDT